jgi:hypothetical protein
MSYGYRENKKLLAITTALGIVLVSIFTWFYIDKSKDWNISKNHMTLTIDSLSVVRNELKNEVFTLAKQLTLEKTTVDGLEAKLDNKNLLINRKDLIIKNANKKLQILEESQKSNVALLNNQILELQGMKRLLSTQIDQLGDENTRLTNTNKVLTDKNNELEKVILTLKSDVGDIKYLATADNFRVDVIKANDKVTAKAKKANILKVSLRIPEFMKSVLAKNNTVFLNITNEKNEPIAGWTKQVSVKDEQGQEMKVAVYDTKTIDFQKNPQKIGFEYPLKEKLKSGTYYAKVYTSDNYLGTVEFSVRDSFWFF